MHVPPAAYAGACVPVIPLPDFAGAASVGRGSEIKGSVRHALLTWVGLALFHTARQCACHVLASCEAASACTCESLAKPPTLPKAPPAARRRGAGSTPTMHLIVLELAGAPQVAAALGPTVRLRTPPRFNNPVLSWQALASNASDMPAAQAPGPDTFVSRPGARQRTSVILQSLVGESDGMHGCGHASMEGCIHNVGQLLQEVG